MKGVTQTEKYLVFNPDWDGGLNTDILYYALWFDTARDCLKCARIKDPDLTLQFLISRKGLLGFCLIWWRKQNKSKVHTELV